MELEKDGRPDESRNVYKMLNEICSWVTVIQDRLCRLSLSSLHKAHRRNDVPPAP